MSSEVVYEFGKFRCDPQERLLLCDGTPVSLSPKAFEILVALIRSKGRLLMKDDLMQQVWPDSFVEDANLTVNISALRKALGETPEGPQHIETVPKRGYRFVTPVIEHNIDVKVKGPLQAQAIEQQAAPPDIASIPNRHARYRLWWTAGALLVVAILVSLLVSSRHAVLAEKDTVVLADFVNNTGDPIFSDALRQGLSSQLEQSPFLNLLSEERMAQTLSLLAQPKGSRLTNELARKVCQRTASAAVLEGTIAQVGSQYLLTLKAINCSSGDSLGSAEAEAADKDHVLQALGKIASDMRSRLGESLASVQQYDAPPQDVTTPSLEALKAYSLGYQAMFVNSDFAGAIPLFQQAINLDPKFAMGYARIGTCYFNLDESVLAAESLRKAYAFRDRVSERERLYITSHYETFVTGDLNAAREVFELSGQIYPRDTSFANLGIIYSDLGEYDKALPAFKEDVRLNPGTGIKYGNLLSGYLNLNRLDEARQTAGDAIAHNVDSAEIHINLYWINFLRNDAAGMEKEAADVLSKPGFGDQMLNYEADTAAYRGRLAQARELARRAIDAANTAGEKEAAAFYEADAAVREALVLNADLAKQRAKTALSLSSGRDVSALAAIALALAGDSERATHLANDLANHFPADTIARFSYLPTIRAAAWLHAGDAAKALDALTVASPYELGGNHTLNFVLYPVFLRGEVYLAAKQSDAAQAEFQKILDHAGVARNEPIAALAHLQLGRTYALSGDTGKASSAYSDFFNLWKNADPDIPILKQAKAEYARLR